ncbi:MAG: endo alpha-1,4 polygalactosaminidase [Candidatus Uhrbacteria bacterium]
MQKTIRILIVLIVALVVLNVGLLLFRKNGTNLELPPPSSTDAPGVWRPAPGTSWQWQLTALPIDTAVNADVFDIDLFDNDHTMINALHAKGRKVICYVNVGTVEDWRQDASEFPEAVIGDSYDEWEGERWLDIRQITLIGPIMGRRFDRAKEMGCDAIEPDNIDGYTNDTGFRLRAADQLRYDVWLVGAAHNRGMSIGLKNDPEHAAILEPYFDWAITEDCAAEGWCDDMSVFTQKGKAVLQAEYTDTDVDFLAACERATINGFSAIQKQRDLDAWRRSCP